MVLFLKGYFVEGERCSDAVSRGLRKLFSLLPWWWWRPGRQWYNRLAHSTYPIMDQCQPGKSARPAAPQLWISTNTWPGPCLRVCSSWKPWPPWVRGRKPSPSHVTPGLLPRGLEVVQRTGTIPSSSFPWEILKAPLKGSGELLTSYLSYGTCLSFIWVRK